MYSEERAVTPQAVSTYWANQNTDDPFGVNGFNGTFAFSDHSLIPEPHVEFLLEYFRKRLGEGRKNHLNVIPLEDINEIMNEVWEGPGSVIKLVNLTYELRKQRFTEVPDDVKNTLKGYDTPTYESDIGKSAVD
jgi:hypothetical protein|tara:strand:- start:570 stop:971 length:402 start_codon:yes stop_codon:yes gene_type:complete